MTRPVRARTASASRWVAGVDGCRGGFVVVLLDAALGAFRVDVVGGVDALLALAERPVRIAIDMPIGLLAHAERGGRACDRAARGLLGRRASTLFSPPSRAALEVFRRGGAFAEVCAAERAASPDALGLSQQAFHLLPKIDALDRALDPILQRRVFEAHPELAFAAMNDGEVLALPKKTAEGAAARSRLLARSGLPRALSGLAAPRGAHRDDLLDACAMAWTARRHLLGVAARLPDASERDARGLAMEIWR